MNVGSILARMRQMCMRVVVALVDDAPKMQQVQVKGLSEQDRDQVERWQNYGFTSVPFPGAEGVAIAIGGSSDHLAVLVVDDRRYRITADKPGEVRLYDDQGQSVHLSREGIVVRGAGLPMVFEDTPSITFKASENVRFEAPGVQFAGAAIELDAAATMTHAGQPVDRRHKHGGIQPGGGKTDTPTS